MQQLKHAEPIQPVVALPSPQLAPATPPPPLEAIDEGPELESEQWASEQSTINMIPVVEKKLSMEINKNNLLWK